MKNDTLTATDVTIFGNIHALAHGQDAYILSARSGYFNISNSQREMPDDGFEGISMAKAL